MASDVGSDEMMWRYYELLTDVQVLDIQKMKSESHSDGRKSSWRKRL